MKEKQLIIGAIENVFNLCDEEFLMGSCKNLINAVGSLPMVSLFRIKFLSNLIAMREFQFAITLFLTEDRSSFLIINYSRTSLNHS